LKTTLFVRGGFENVRGGFFKKMKKTGWGQRGLVGNKLRTIFEIKGDVQKLRAIYSLLNP
jgi:hypothetical protein